MLILIIAIGCALGGIIRYLGMTWITRLVGERFPWGTLLVNAMGSFLLGLFFAAGANSQHAWFAAEGVQVFALVGICGGLTTFSTFSLQTLGLVSEQAWGRALGNVLGSVLLCVFCVISGYTIGESLVS